MSKRIITLIIVIAMVFTMLIGCGKKSTTADQKDEAAVKKSEEKSQKDEAKQDEPKETPYIEVWRENVGYLEVDKEGPQSKFFIENVGIGVYQPYVPWEGGKTYVQKLNTRIATGDLPDMFLPWEGNEITLIQQGALADLTDYLPKYAPHVWELIPKNVWDVVRASDPTGKDRIYYIPKVNLFNNYGSFIRTDWLKRVGKDMPKTQAELEDVLRAFKEQDANGNGDPNDEIPTSGREFGRWMDYLFGMFGVAMWEGYPQWDLYDGELTYSGVTGNMKEAIVYIKKLYDEGLLDSETFLNSSSDWKAKITSDQVGIWYHLAQYSNSRFEAIQALNEDATFEALPNISVEGYEGFITHKSIVRPQWVIAKKDEETIINALTLLDFAYNNENRELNTFRVEGYDHEVVDGKRILIPKDKGVHENEILKNELATIDDFYYATELMMSSVAEERKWIFEEQLKVQKAFQDLHKTIAGDGMPNAIFEGFSDLQQHTLYQEYMTMIIIGEWPIEKFNEFVDLWYQTGGEEVTKRARDWYKKVKNIN